MSVDWTYVDSMLSDRPDYSIAGEPVPGPQPAYFAEELTDETIAEFSKMPEDTVEVKRSAGKGSGLKSRGTSTRNRFVKKTAS